MIYSIIVPTAVIGGAKCVAALGFFQFLPVHIVPHTSEILYCCKPGGVKASWVGRLFKIPFKGVDAKEIFEWNWFYYSLSDRGGWGIAAKEFQLAGKIAPCIYHQVADAGYWFA